MILSSFFKRGSVKFGKIDNVEKKAIYLRVSRFSTKVIKLATSGSAVKRFTDWTNPAALISQADGNANYFSVRYPC